MKFKLVLFSILIIVLNFPNIYGQDPKTVKKKVPWDSVMAEIQTAMNIPKPDSVKAGYLKGIFSRFRIDGKDYDQFYREFQAWKPDKQRSFLLEVEKILFNEMRDLGSGQLQNKPWPVLKKKK